MCMCMSSRCSAAVYVYVYVEQVLGGGVYLLDGYRVALCAWRVDAGAPAHLFSPPVACPAPLGTAVSVAAKEP